MGARAAAALLLLASPAAAWGPRGHELVTSAALELLSERRHPLAAFLEPNAGTLARLALAPDRDWQLSGSAADAPTLRQREVDALERPLHVFEADAFVDPAARPDAIARLPAADYGAAAPEYLKLLEAEGRGAGGLGEAAAHGTAPWRVLQLWDAAVAALKARDAGRALLDLGALSNYVGEMSQPFDTTRNYDDASPSAGACAAFEMGLLEEAARAGHARRLAREVAAEAAADLPYGSLALIGRERVVPEVLRLVDSGYPYVRPLLDAYTARGAPERGSPGFLRAFAAAPLPDDPAHGIVKLTTTRAAERRLAAGAALLARLWASAYDAAGAPALAPAAIPFTGYDLLADYPAPDYLPEASAAGGPPPGPSGSPAPGAPAGDAGGRVVIPPPAGPGAEAIVPIADLMANKAGYEGKIFCVAGRTAYVVQRDSKKGNHYFTLWLHDGPDRLKVFGHGYPNFGEAQLVEACGYFQRKNRVGPMTFFDEFTAQAILKGKAIHAGWVRLDRDGVTLLRGLPPPPPPKGP